MFNYSDFFSKLNINADYKNDFLKKIEYRLNIKNFDEFLYFNNIFAQFPQIKPSILEFEQVIKIGSANDITQSEKKIIFDLLKKLMPWRKGPFDLFGIGVDAEWQSSMKWDRVSKNISSLEGRNVMDIGCGNGYYIFRMKNAGARIVLGVDPFMLFVFQFFAFHQYVSDNSFTVIPVSSEEIPKTEYFDTVFSMGVLSHRMSPLDHLKELFYFLRDDGELVLETLIFDSSNEDILFPKDRYAKMRNIWFIPSIKMLTLWLKRIGFKNIRHDNIVKTTQIEQRKTNWMDFESLDQFVDSKNTMKTIEGYQSPSRIIFIANK